MKNIAASLLMLAIAASASGAGTMNLQGTEFRVDTIEHYYVGPGITHTHLQLTAASRKVQVFAATLDRADASYTARAVPRVVIGKDQCRTAETVSSMGTRKTSESMQYLIGVNGDFFITSAFAGQHEFGNAILGYPNMSCVIDGMIAAPDMIDITSRENALIMGADGNMWIDATDLQYRLESPDGQTTVYASAINYPRRDNELMLYNPYIGASTGTSGGRELLLRKDGGADWNINGTVPFTVVGTWTQGGNTAVPADGLVISCGPAYSNEYVDGLRAGDRVNVAIRLTLPAFGGIAPDVKDVIGGDVRILKEGTVTTSAIRWINTPSAQYPRSLAGYSQDRSKLVFAAVDGGSSTSTGVSYYEGADLMAALGCYDALDMDGGGSTAMWTSHAGIVNHLRDGSERAVGNALFFAVEAPKDAAVTSIRFADSSKTLPALASYRPVIYGYNQYGQLVDTDVQGVSLSAPADFAEITGGAVVPLRGGSFALKAAKDGMEASIAVHVSDDAEIEAASTSVLTDNVRQVPVLLQSTVDGKILPVDARAFSWTSSNPEIVQVDSETGVLTGVSEGNATITGSRGERAVSIGVTVEIASAPMLQLDPEIGGVGWKITRSGIGSDATCTTSGGTTTLDFNITSTRSTSLTLAKNITAYSLPDGFSMTVEPAAGKISDITLRVQAANSSKSVSVSAGAVESAGKVDFDIASAIDLTDNAAYPLKFNSILLRPAKGSDGSAHCTVRLSDVGFTYSHFESGVQNVLVPDGEAPLRLKVGADGIEAPASVSAIEVYSASGMRLSRTGGNIAPLPAAGGVYIVRAFTPSGSRSAKVAL